jgi:hypothetical protein
VAPLSAEAQAARAEASRLRNEAQALKLVVRVNLACSRERLGAAHIAFDRAQAEPLPSPWSELRWNETYAMLDRTLVPVD